MEKEVKSIEQLEQEWRRICTRKEDLLLSLAVTLLQFLRSADEQYLLIGLGKLQEYFRYWNVPSSNRVLRLARIIG